MDAFCGHEDCRCCKAPGRGQEVPGRSFQYFPAFFRTSWRSDSLQSSLFIVILVIITVIIFEDTGKDYDIKTYNYSRQREAIYRFLLHRKDHPTAETIYQHVRQEYPRISLGTIYRNLSLLEETGQIQKVPSDDSRDHYDADISCHPHFVCTCCHRVLDLKMDDLGFLNTLASQGFDGEILRSQLTFYGLCGDCKCSKSEP